MRQESTSGQDGDMNCIGPLHNNQYPDGLVNIVIRKVVVRPSVNVDDSVCWEKSK